MLKSGKANWQPLWLLPAGFVCVCVYVCEVPGAEDGEQLLFRATEWTAVCQASAVLFFCASTTAELQGNCMAVPVCSLIDLRLFGFIETLMISRLQNDTGCCHGCKSVLGGTDIFCQY